MKEEQKLKAPTTHSGPPGKAVALQLIWYDVGQFYEVASITNTTWYKPGARLSPVDAEKCCQITNWQVTMVENAVWQAILNHITDIIP